MEVEAFGGAVPRGGMLLRDEKECSGGGDRGIGMLDGSCGQRFGMV